MRAGNPYNYNQIVTQFGAGGFTHANRKAIRSALKNLQDGSYETMAQRDPSQPTIFGGTPIIRSLKSAAVLNSNFPTNSISRWKTRYR